MSNIDYDEDLNDTARLVLMEVTGTVPPESGVWLRPFVHRMREEVGPLGLVELAELYTKYMGYGVRLPTHDLATGHRRLGR